MAKRDDIIEAALDIVCSQGIRALILPTLFKHAHTGAGTFYHYFADRDDLLDVVYDRCCAVAMESLADVVHMDADPHERFVEVCCRMFDAYEVHAREMTFLYLYAYGYAEPDERVCRTIPSLTVLTSIISDAQAQGMISCDLDPVVSARVVRGTIASVYWCYERGICPMTHQLARDFSERTWKAMVG